MSDSKPTLPVSLPDALRKARQTRRVEVGPGAIRAAAAVFREQFGDRAAVIVADPTTLAVAGHAVAEVFSIAGHVLKETILFPEDDLYAEFGFVERLEAALRRHDAIPVAVGAGTINDLVKLAAHRVGRPYLCIATAASMDGYTAFGASITFKGSKQTFDCPAPVAVIADMDVIAAAPGAMTASGYADLLAKVTAGADWLVADALGIDPVETEAWNIVQGGLRAALADPQSVRRQDPGAIRRLTEGLLMGGFAMQWAQSSRPASGAEHQFSHLWDMQHHTHDGVAPSHGFKVGIATIASCALYDYILSQPLERLDPASMCVRWPEHPQVIAAIRRTFTDPDIAEKAIEETTRKHLTRSALSERLVHLRGTWPQLRTRLREQLLDATELRALLHAAGAPCEPEQIGISRRRLRDSFHQARYIRGRYTVLDLAFETGHLDGALQGIFGPKGLWPAEMPVMHPQNLTPAAY